MEVFYGLAIPFLGIVLGSAMVVFMKNRINKKLEKLLLGFVAGARIYVVVEELIPEIICILLLIKLYIDYISYNVIFYRIL